MYYILVVFMASIVSIRRILHITDRGDSWNDVRRNCSLPAAAERLIEDTVVLVVVVGVAVVAKRVVSCALFMAP